MSNLHASELPDDDPGDVVDISVAIPCLNEAENAAAIAEAVGRELTAAGVTYEMIFIDNGSTDGTVDIIKGLCALDPRIRLIVNNRNYGQMRSPTHAIYQGVGRAVIGISADFQDPPELLGEIIARWRAGAKIVLGVKRSEDALAPIRWGRRLGYAFLNRYGDYPVVPGATGFGLYDREVVDCLAAWREPEPFFRGMLVESGFALSTVPYHRPDRAGGQTKNNLGTIIAFGLSGLASSSKALLRVPMMIAVWTMALAGLTAAGVIAAAVGGWMSWAYLLAVPVEVAFAILFLFLGLLGEQVRLISERTRNTPLVIEKERVNFPPARGG